MFTVPEEGDWSRCVEILGAMGPGRGDQHHRVQRHDERVLQGEAEAGAGLFETMPQEGHVRSTITYNVAMSACMRTGTGSAL